MSKKKSFFSPIPPIQPVAESEGDLLAEEGQILSLDSLRAAFSGVESSTQTDDGFGWGWGEKPQHHDQEKLITSVTEEKSAGLTELVESESVSDWDEEEYTTGLFVEESDEDLAEVGDNPMLEHRIEMSPQSLFEAMLFVGNKHNRPLFSEKASELMRNVPAEEIDVIAQTIARQYLAWNCPYEAIAFEGGYRLVLREEFESVRAKFYGRIKEARLSQSAIDILAIVAYKQPITSEEVQRIHKQPVGPILAQLVRRDLLTVTRESQGNRSVAFYKTTDRFLRVFGLASIDDLPVSEDYL